MKNCIYKFLNNKNEVIYIGKAKDLEQRLSNHNHLSCECYKELSEVRYCTFNTEDEMDFAERYYIPRYNPKYNTLLKEKSITISIKEFDNVIWNLYKKPSRKEIIKSKSKLKKQRSNISHYEKYIKLIEKNKIKEFNEKINKKVICTTTGEIFNNMNEIKDIYNISLESIVKHCEEKYLLSLVHPIYKCIVTFMYYEDYKENLRKDKSFLKDEFEKNTRKVICLNTKEEFINLAYAENKYKVKGVKRCCNGDANYSGIVKNTPLVWKWLDEFENMTENEVYEHINKAIRIASRLKAI